MLNSVLQWKDAKKEDPLSEGIYFVVLRGHDHLTFSLWNKKRKQWGGYVQYWAAIPTAEQVRQKFRDLKLREEAN